MKTPTDSERLDWLDHHCSFVADYEYCIGPFKVGELRQMADAGIRADEELRGASMEVLRQLGAPVDL